MGPWNQLLFFHNGFNCKKMQTLKVKNVYFPSETYSFSHHTCYLESPFEPILLKTEMNSVSDLILKSKKVSIKKENISCHEFSSSLAIKVNTSKEMQPKPFRNFPGYVADL